MTAASLLIALLTSGCFSTIEGGPPRLFSIAEESGVARARLTVGEEAYYSAPAAQNRRVRNEIIAARMRAIDTYYYAFEASLIRERQEIGFISSIISIGLSGAVPLVSATQTKNILGAASSGVQGATKAFSDEVLFQKTVQVLATQMRARRDAVAADIFTRMKTLDIDAYPLSMGLSDIDAYYAAGTIAGALIEIQKTVSDKAKDGEDARTNAVEVTFVSNAATQSLQACLRKPGAREGLLALMTPPSRAVLGRLTVSNSPADEAQRMDLLGRARSAGVC